MYIMINYWWVTRPKRKLNSIPEVLAAFAEISLDQEWQGQRATHLSLEEALEQSGLKRIGERRDQRGGGGRTYRAWLASLGLIFIQESTGKLKLTLAGEAIMEGDSPVQILTNQILKYQFPSAFSLSRGVRVSERFKIRPFVFLFRLLTDRRIEYLTEDEIAKIIITEAENESESCYKAIVSRILEYREVADSCLSTNFFTEFAPKSGQVNPDHPFSHLTDTANTIINWIEYTQLAKRDDEKKLRILEDKLEVVHDILNNLFPFIDRPQEQEYYQRKFGLDPRHKKDTRNLTDSKTITMQMIAEQKIKQAFIGESLKCPISKITNALVEKIAELTGIEVQLVEETLVKLYPHGAVGAFMTEYFEMAFKGRDEATMFEKATVTLFQDVFNFEAEHVGPIGRTPDVHILSHQSRYAGIIDNKAYSNYSISNDHKNRMIHNYIPKFSQKVYPLAFFSYIAGGFGKNISTQLREIAMETSIHGSALSVSNLIQMVEKHQTNAYSHERLKMIFSVDRLILSSDL